jgi:hypothetical protein
MTRAFRAGTFFPTFAFAVFRDWNAYGINRAPENGAYVSFLFRRRVKKTSDGFFDARCASTRRLFQEAKGIAF